MKKNLNKKIHARHIERVDSNGKPIEKIFSTKSWQALPSLTKDNVTISKQGWVQIDPKATNTPPEAAKHAK